LENLLGAFADSAVLFPLLASLSLQGGFSGPTLLATAGGAYLAAAWIFRIPMPVQPLKAIAIASLAMGASRTEIQLSGLLLGLFCLALSVPVVERFAQKIPVSLIQALQLALGIILFRQGLKLALNFSVDEVWKWNGMGTWALTGILLIGSWLTKQPFLGLVAVLGLGWAVATANSGTGDPRGPSILSAVAAPETLRISIVLSLVFPQLALTFFNSVLGTKDAAQRYFGPAAERVTIARLLRSIGFGNVLVAMVGGLPFCHGSGGLTAHYRGGARHWSSNLFIGITLLLFALIQFLRASHSLLQYPAPLLASLLMTIGILHVTLIKTTWQSSVMGKTLLIASGITALWTQNILWVLGLAVFIEVLFALNQRKTRWAVL
jgi:hypothetical protein